MHYTIKETPGPTNVVPARAVGEFSLRSYSWKCSMTCAVGLSESSRGGSHWMADVGV